MWNNEIINDTLCRGNIYQYQYAIYSNIVIGVARFFTLSFSLCSYQFAVILLIYLLPLLVMLVTYSLVGRTLWGGHIPGEATEHYHSQITAKRKVAGLFFFFFMPCTLTLIDMFRLQLSWTVSSLSVIDHRWWRWWLSWWWPLPSAGCPITSTSYWDHLTETFINSITFNRLAAAFLSVINSF